MMKNTTRFMLFNVLLVALALVGAPIVILEVEGEGNEAQHKPKNGSAPPATQA